MTKKSGSTTSIMTQYKHTYTLSIPGSPQLEDPATAQEDSFYAYASQVHSRHAFLG